MRIFLYILLVFSSISLFAQNGEMILNGVYKGKNLYVQNPFTGNMKDFCINEVHINGTLKMSSPQSSAFEIDLSFLKLGDPIMIKITHSDDCKPKVLNPQIIRNDEAEFNFISFNVDNKKMNWSAKGESTGCKYFVQQFVQGKWINSKQVDGKGSPTQNEYSNPVTHHSGINKYRIKYLDVHGKVIYSHIVEFNSSEENVTFYPARVTGKITLSRAVPYEVMDSFGNVVKKGSGDIIDCTDLKSGVYYLNMHNQTEKFFKK